MISEGMKRCRRRPSASIKPNISAARNTRGGLPPPKITHATATNPREALIFSENIVRYPRLKCAPDSVASMPHSTDASSFMRPGFTPAARRASGASPDARR